MDEKALESEILPTSTMRLLRFRFWQEYQRVQATKTENGLNVSRICEAVINPSFFIEKLFYNSFVCAWMVLPPKSYEDAMEETLSMGVQRLREIFEIPIRKEKHKRDEKGEIISTEVVYDMKAAALILRAYNQVESRMKGGIVQRHQIAATNIDPEKLQRQREELSMEQITQRLKQLESKEDIIDVAISRDPERPVTEEKF